LTKNPLIYSVSYFNFEGFVAFLGGLAHQCPVATGLVTNRRLFRKLYFGCSAVITTSYVRRLLRWTTLFSYCQAAVA